VLIDPHCAALVWMRGAEALIDRHRSGVIEVDEAGVVLFPDTYYNLLYHCFGETSASRPSAMSGYRLPWQGWPYATSDGLGDAVPAPGLAAEAPLGGNDKPMGSS
jgi:hypothetical protein